MILFSFIIIFVILNFDSYYFFPISTSYSLFLILFLFDINIIFKFLNFYCLTFILLIYFHFYITYILVFAPWVCSSHVPYNSNYTTGFVPFALAAPLNIFKGHTYLVALLYRDLLRERRLINVENNLLIIKYHSRLIQSKIWQYRARKFPHPKKHYSDKCLDDYFLRSRNFGNPVENREYIWSTGEIITTKFGSKLQFWVESKAKSALSFTKKLRLLTF